MTQNLTDVFIDDLYELRAVDVSAAVILQSKRCLLDYLGVTFAGAQLIRTKGLKLLHSFGDSPKNDAKAIGFDQSLSTENAAFMNGLSSHAAELDDGIRYGALHPGSPIFSALLPMAEKFQVDNLDFARGTLVGYEAATRLARTMQPSHYNCGHHPTATCGTLGATIGIATMLGFSKPQMKDAFSAAALSASGSLKVLEDVSELKPLNVARAAQTAILSTNLARAGFRGPHDVLTGANGFLSMLSKEQNLSYLRQDEDKAFYLEKIYFKLYASCRHTHAAIEAALKIRSNSGLRPSDVRDICVRTYQGVIGIHDHTDIHGVSSAKMSLPFSLAVALSLGKAGIQDFGDEQVQDSAILSLTRKVRVLADQDISALVPKKRAAIVEITTHTGARHIERVDYPKGEPENPLSEAELIEKFFSLAAYGKKSQAECQEIVKGVLSSQMKLNELYPLL
jgi:2-methylcitrate dehydratase PrpD